VPDEFPDCRLVGKVALYMLDFTQLRIVEIPSIQ